MNYHEINDIARERLAQFNKEADDQRRIQAAEQSGNFYRPALAEVGRRLSDLGQQLQERYGAEPVHGLANGSH